MKYILLTTINLLLQVLSTNALSGDYDRRADNSKIARDVTVGLQERSQTIKRDHSIPPSVSLLPRNSAISAGLDRYRSSPLSLRGELHVPEALELHRRHAYPAPSYSYEAYHRREVIRRKALLRSKPLGRQRSKRADNHRSTFPSGAMQERNIAASNQRLIIRSPKHHKNKESKEQKDINGAKKLLASDLKAEHKDQDKATQKALGGINKAQRQAEEATRDEINRARKFQGEDRQRIAKAQSELAKVSRYKGASGKDGRKYQKALENEQKAESDLVKLKQKGAAAMSRINGNEEGAVSKTESKMDKAMAKAHSDQFGDKGARLARSHPSAWARFKHVMSKIAEAIDWAVAGLSMLIPGAEEYGLARMTAKAAEMVARKFATKGAEKGIKKGSKEGMKQLRPGVMISAVDFAKTETDAQVAAAKANEKQGKDQVYTAAQKMHRPASDAALNKQLYGRYIAQLHTSWHPTG